MLLDGPGVAKAEILAKWGIHLARDTLLPQ